MSIIPRKFNNSKGQNFFTEVQNTKRLNRLMKELKNNHDAAKKDAHKHSDYKKK